MALIPTKLSFEEKVKEWREVYFAIDNILSDRDACKAEYDDDDWKLYDAQQVIIKRLNANNLSVYPD